MRKYKLSPSEQRLYDLIIKHNGRVTTEQLTEQYWPDKRKRPYNARQVISNLTRALVGKTKAMRDLHRVRRSAPSGPRSTEVWIERRSAA